MLDTPLIQLPEDRYFDPDPKQKEVAVHLHSRVADLPLVCPHGHVDPRMFADPDYSFGSPADMFIRPDHYVFRMLYSQGIPMERLGIQRQDGEPVETDPRKIWQLFADNFYLYRGTPTGMWLTQELYQVFDVRHKLNGDSAQDIYDHIVAKLQLPEFRPRRLFETFNVEVLCTTDSAIDTLAHHQAIRDSGWSGRVLPTFRLDVLINLSAPGWREQVAQLGELTGAEITSFKGFIHALEERRAFFKSMGAVASDHDAFTAYTEELSDEEAEEIFGRALAGEATQDDTVCFRGHMLMESARMSVEDGLVMQVHAGSYRNHNQSLSAQFGPDNGSDIPILAEFTRSLHPLLNKFGNDPRLTLIMFTLDESTYSRELAPLAGHYPALKLGPAWWFNDSLYGMTRYRQQMMDTTGIYNTVGFNDDTRAFPSIPARHDLARRMDANWLAGLVVRGVIDRLDAEEMIYDLAYRLPKKSYKFE